MDMTQRQTGTIRPIVTAAVLAMLPWLASGCAWMWPGNWVKPTTPTAAGTAVDPSQDASLLKRAMQARDLGRLDEALAAFEKALETNPNLVEAHIGVGDIYHIKGDYNEAAKRYDRARQIEPRNFTANYKLGLMYHLLDRLADAVNAYLSALSIDPNNYEANLNLATAYLQLNQPSLGLPYAQRAVEINRKSMVAWANLAAIQSALGQYDPAIDSYRAAMEWGELEPQIALGLVDAFVKTSRFQQAINTLKALNARAPSAMGYERLGYIHFKLGQYDESLAAYETAHRLDPSDPASLNGIGVNYMTRYLQGEREDKTLKRQAMDAWQRSVRVKPDQQRIIDLIARYSDL